MLRRIAIWCLAIGLAAILVGILQTETRSPMWTCGSMTIVEVDGQEIVTEHSDGIGWEPPLPGPFALEAGVWLTLVGSVLLLFRPKRRSRAAFLASRVHDL